jgi:hypothetical protein
MSSSVHDLFGTVPAIDWSVLDSIRAVAFWMAIVLPFLYIPLLVSGLDSTPIRIAFAVLLVANGIALFVGHSYARD